MLSIVICDDEAYVGKKMKTIVDAVLSEAQIKAKVGEIDFTALAGPLLADGRFVQPHRSYVVNLAYVRLLAPGELQMASGARVPLPRGREAALRQALEAWLTGEVPAGR